MLQPPLVDRMFSITGNATNVCPSVMSYGMNRMNNFFFSTVEATVIDNSDGSYGVSYTPEEPGAYSVWVCVRAQHVKVRNFLTADINVFIVPPPRPSSPLI